MSTRRSRTSETPRPTGPEGTQQAAERYCRLLEQIDNRCGFGWDTFGKVLEVCLEATKVAQLRPSEIPTWRPELDRLEPARDLIAEAYGELLAGSVGDDGGPSYQDVIGTAYMLYGQAKKHAGQFFTPWHVAHAMADMTMGGRRVLSDPELERFTPLRPMRVLDPACGSGIMLLAAASVLPREFVDAGRLALFGVDLDHTCVQMARLNLALYGLAWLEPPLGRRAAEGTGVKHASALTVEEVEAVPEPQRTAIKEYRQATMFDGLGDGR